MFRTKKDVDRHVQDILRKLKTESERNLRCYNVAKLYYQVGDYESARRYVSSYLEVREESPGAHKLLGQTLEALGQKEAALAQYKASLELEGRQDDLVLKVCELLADTDVGMDVSRARYWMERADRQFPHHPVVFQLKEKLLTIDRPNDNAEDLEALIASELTARPMDVSLRVKLLRHYTEKNRLEDAYKHAAGVESMHALRDNITWYQALCEMLAKCKDSKRSDWSFWVLYVSALERFAALSLKEQGDGPKKTIPEAAQAVFNFDQSLTEAEPHKKISNDPAFADQLYMHMWGQLQLHLACLLLRKTKREQGSWSEAGRLCAPLLLGALHTNPSDPTALWANRLKDQYRSQVQLWYREGSYRCSQAGHVLQDYARDDTKRFLEKIDKFCTGAWRERVYQRIFVSRVQQQLIKNSFFANHTAPNPPLRLCTHSELKHHDEVSEEVWPASLHHQVWLGIKSKPHHSHNNRDIGPHPHQHSHIFSELQLSVYNLNQAAADSLSRLDIDAFLNAAVFCASVVVEEQQRSGFLSPDRLPTLPADITNILCSSGQEKWWSAAYKMYREQEGVGGEVGEIRQVLQRGLEVVRCIGNHGLHPSLLVHLARIFHHRVKVLKGRDEEHIDIPSLEARCELYWLAAVPLLERLQNNQAIRSTSDKLFDYQGKEMNNVELTNALEEGRLLLAQRYLRDKQHEQAIEALQTLKCPEASFQQGQIYKKLADELVSSLPRESLTSEMRSQHIIMLSKARDCFYLTLDRLRSPGMNPKHPLNSELCTHVSAIENELKRIDPDLWRSDLNRNECDGMSDESYSSAHSGDQPVINPSLTGLGSSVHMMSTPQRTTHRTPKQSTSTPCRPQHQDVLDLSRNRTEARPSPERLDAQIRQLIHSKDNVIQAIMEQNKLLLESDKAVKEKLEELTKEVNDLRKEIQKQRSQAAVSQNLEEDLYVLGEEDYGDLNYGATTSTQPAGPTSSFPTNIFPPSQRHPAYSQLVYPLQGYYQGGLPFNDPAAQHIPPLYSHGVYPMPALYPRAPVDQTLGPLAKIPESVLQQTLFGSRLPNQMPDHLPVIDQSQPVQPQKLEQSRSEITIRDAPVNKAPPVNVVITTSDTLPTTAPPVQPTLSVTIPAHHRLGGNAPAAGINIPHNYQISMPSHATIPTTVNLPPLSTTITTSILHNMSEAEKSKGANNSILSTGSANESNEWYVEPEHDPIPNFVPVIPLPAEVEVTTGEEGETTLYCGRAKLFRFVEKEWKERGVGVVKLLRNTEGKVRLLMRRDQVLKICANHMLREDMELSKMPNNNKALIWVANDFADEEVRLEKLCIKFKTEDEALNFKQCFDNAKSSMPPSPEKPVETVSKNEGKTTKAEAVPTTPVSRDPSAAPVVVGGFSFSSKPIIQEQKAADTAKTGKKAEESKPSPFAGFSFSKPDAEEKPTSVTSTAPAVTLGTGVPFRAKPADPQPTGFSFIKTTQAVPATGTFTFGKPVGVLTSTPTVITETGAAGSPAALPSVTGVASPISPFPPLTPLRRPHVPAPAELAAAAAAATAGAATPSKSDKSIADSTGISKEAGEETVEEFVPTAEFAPVISLPDIVDVVTGEEGETILFEQRAKLLRFDGENKAWKERGIGQMKVLLDPTSGKVRLLMRREQVLKVCCNHTLLAEIQFTYMRGSNKDIMWCAQDYSEGEMRTEMFTVRFKTADQASEFHKTVTTNQQKMVNDRVPVQNTTAGKKIDTQGAPLLNDVKPRAPVSSKETKHQKSLTSESALPSSTKNAKHQKSLAEIFKPAVGSWECKECYTRNDAAKTKCIACEAPSPSVPKQPTSSGTPSPASWECKSCYTKNYGLHKCEACGTQSPAAQTAAAPENVPLSQLFKPAAGSWECKGCYIVNSGTNIYCVACDSPKDPSMPPKPKASGFNVAVSSASAPTFSFGVPQAGAKEASGSFTFGMPKSDAKGAGDSVKSPAAMTFGMPAKGDSGGMNFKFGMPQGNGETKANKECPFTFGSPGKSFDFHFQAKSPVKSPGGGETSEDEVAESEDVYFPPVIPLPDRVEIKTGEEDEEILYSHRAKLFRFDSHSKEWKERGLGLIKLLRHKLNGKLRLIMRRDQVLKLCLNHVVPQDMEITAKDDRTWLWCGADFSEGEIEHEKFACRFKTPEIAQEFKQAVESAKNPGATPAETAPKANAKSLDIVKKHLFKETSPSSDVEVLYELKVTPEEKAQALSLQLPENFYAYRQKPDCPGCIGCDKSSESLFDKSSASTKPSIVPSPFSAASVLAPKPSVFGSSAVNSPSTAKSTTPADSPATTVSGTSIFGGSSKKTGDSFSTTATTTTVSTTTSTIFGGGFTAKPTITFGASPAAPAAIFAGSPAAVTTTSSVITFGDSGKTVFGGTKPGGFLFGAQSNETSTTVSSNTSAPNAKAAGVYSFGGSLDKSSIFEEKSDTKSIENLTICSPSVSTPQTTQASVSTVFGGSGVQVFGATTTPNQSLFSGAKSATPIFGANNSTASFGGKTTQENSSGTTTSTTIFGGTPNASANKVTNIFGGSPKIGSTTLPSAAKTVFGEAGKVTSVFGGSSSSLGFGAVDAKPEAAGFGSNSGTALTTFRSALGKSTSSASVFGNATTTAASVFGGSAVLFGSTPAFGTGSSNTTSVFGTSTAGEEAKKKESVVSFLPTENVTTFSALAANSPQQPSFKKDPNFTFAGVGTSVFGAKSANISPKPQSKKEQKELKKSEEDDEDEEGDNNDGEEHDPHFEPIVPLPDAIEIRTGEEEEEKVFNQRAKLYRYVTATKEWKERGVGEMKLLHHVANGTFRLLLRREQVHKVVCNLLLTPDIEFHTMNSSDRAWCWAGMNYAEEEPALEKLAVRFKSPELAKQFKNAIDSAQETLREKQFSEQAGQKQEQAPDAQEEVEEEEEDDDEEEDEDEVDEEDDEDEQSIMIEKRATMFAQGTGDNGWQNIGMGDLRMLYDPEIFGARIVLEADGSREIVSNTVICMQTLMQINGKECIWTGIDYALEPPVRRMLKAVFSSVQVAQEMYENYQEGQSYANEAEIIEPEYYISSEE